MSTKQIKETNIFTSLFVLAFYDVTEFMRGRQNANLKGNLHPNLYKFERSKASSQFSSKPQDYWDVKQLEGILSPWGRKKNTWKTKALSHGKVIHIP